MPENNREDFLCRELEYMPISLISHKTKVIIIGGGRAGYIKAKSFSKKGCMVQVISKEFYSKFQELTTFENLNLIKDEYKEDYIKDKHIVIIATDNEDLNTRIKKDCEDNVKIYLYGNDFREGMFVTPVSAKTKNISFSLNTNAGSPKTAVFLLNKVNKELSNLDGFVEYISSIRKKVKGLEHKDEIMEFINSEDFYFFYQKNMQDKILNLFYGRLTL